MATKREFNRVHDCDRSGLSDPMAACMMFKAEVKSLEPDGHVTEENHSSIDVSRGRDSSAFAEKIGLASHFQPKKVTMRVRVAKVRAQCGRQYFSGGFEKLDLTVQEVEDRQHALAQKLIAKTLKQADRRHSWRRRLKIMPLRFPKWNMSTVVSLSPLVSGCRWLRRPFLRLARMASLAASRVERNRKHHPSCRLRCFPVDGTLVPLLSVCEVAC